MKLTAVILSIVILVLSFVPCADTMISRQEFQTISTSHQDNHGHNHSDFCSPLCSCSCCGTVVAQIEEELFFEDFPENEFSTDETFFRQNIPAAIYYSIWEPPKII